MVCSLIVCGWLKPPHNCKPQTTNRKHLKFSIGFLSKIAFICNLCFIGALAIREMEAMQDPVVSTILIAGLVLSIPANVMTLFLYAVVLIQRKPIRNFIPVWLAISNFLFITFQIYMIIR